MSTNALYTDLSGYYDLMCCDINYHAQSNSIARLHQLFGNQGKQHLDLACGTGPHIRHFIDFGYQSSGLDINQPMIDLAIARCPEAQFSVQDMTNFTVEHSQDLITCFLYSIHYSGNTERLLACIQKVHASLNDGGVFCFNSVDKDKINNNLFIRHHTDFEQHQFEFESSWQYSGMGDAQALHLKISRTPLITTETSISETWQDQHPMVATTFGELSELLEPYFEVQIFEHDFDCIIPWDGESGNAVFVCTKK
ncbi:class I SAM-dependent methyltransferase [Shewanella sp. SNU WT4]|uniref:class I SAM-dependent DNA methyltransferase n=1 Tax=Shewanella sp. SNU WT4 TaxID=2590015 RepID=UPI00112803FA|nr:class I SAM-dependent methyltransferase [Shewanella sp. SNU WT4]QDF68558.1 class I SAM-dependent methyltransferase [Shewanella sp. SNU WT4]